MIAVALVTVVVPAIGVVIAAGGAYWGVARKLSGKIETSEAASLWAESKSMREDYRTENKQLRERVDALAGRVDSLGASNVQLGERNLDLEGRVRTLEAENKALGELNSALRDRIDVLEGRLADAGEPINGPLGA